MKLINSLKGLYKVLLICIVLIVFWYFVFKSPTSNQNTHVISEGGVPSEELTHSVWSFDLADLYKSGIIGFNVVSSTDGTLFLIPTNDATFYDSEGTFSSKTDEEIKNIRALNGNRIYSLEFILNRYKDKFHYVVSLDNESSDLIRTIDTFTKYDLNDNLIIRTENVEIIEKIESNKISIMLDTNTTQDLKKNLNNNQIDIINLNKELMTINNIRKIKSNKKLVSVQDLQGVHEIKDAIKLNVDFYLTQHTAKAIALEKKYRKNRK